MKRRTLLAFPALLAARPAAILDVRGDGVALTADQYAHLLSTLVVNAGVVAELERKLAAALGKESAVWLPSEVREAPRIFIEAVCSRRPARDLAKNFDSITAGMTGCFNARAGAVVAGPGPLVHRLRREHSEAADAAVALHFFDGFESRFAAALRVSEAVLKILDVDSNFEVDRSARACNAFRLKATNVNAPVYHGRLEQAGIDAPAPDPSGWFELRVNETWNRMPAAEIVSRFRIALG